MQLDSGYSYHQLESVETNIRVDTPLQLDSDNANCPFRGKLLPADFDAMRKVKKDSSTHNSCTLVFTLIDGLGPHS